MQVAIVGLIAFGQRVRERANLIPERGGIAFREEKLVFKREQLVEPDSAFEDACFKPLVGFHHILRESSIGFEECVKHMIEEHPPISPTRMASFQEGAFFLEGMRGYESDLLVMNDHVSIPERPAMPGMLGECDANIRIAVEGFYLNLGGLEDVLHGEGVELPGFRQVVDEVFLLAWDEDNTPLRAEGFP